MDLLRTIAVILVWLFLISACVCAFIVYGSSDKDFEKIKKEDDMVSDEDIRRWDNVLEYKN